MKQFTIAILGCLVLTFSSHAAELARLTPETWDEFAPKGKEVDCIYGDYVLRNERIVVVIAEPLPTRNANMTVRSVGAMIIDLTKRAEPNDQLSCYFSNGMPLVFSKPETVRVLVDEQPQEARKDLKVAGKHIVWQASTVSESGLEVTVKYTLTDGQDWIAAETTLHNPKAENVTQELSDLIRADRTFTFGNDDQTGLFWADDEYFRQAYGVVVEGRRLKITGSRRNVLQMLDQDDKSAVVLKPDETLTLSRKIFPGSSLLEVRQIANALAKVKAEPLTVQVSDPRGAVAGAKLTVTLDGAVYGTARTPANGSLTLQIPAGKLRVSAEATGRETVEMDVEERSAAKPVKLTMKSCGYVVAEITNDKNEPTPCKVAFHGKNGTPTPDYGPDSADTAVKNVYYAHNGRFRQEISPGQYDVIVSYGPEHDAVFTEISVKAGEEKRLTAQLKRTVDTSGWISADFHSHSTPSGDNTSSQLGRVQNLLCEHVEFCPCTEHNRIDSYAPLLKQLEVEHLMATCTGMELTGQLLPVNHQNAFPLLHKPRTQDGGGPRTDDNPVVQIERLALWDGGSEKLVQENHPNLVQVFADKDEDGKHDGGFSKMLEFMDVVEVHPLPTIFAPPTRNAEGKLSRNPIFHWMQLLNLGYRIPGVVNTDAHYVYHESGWLRNYLKSSTDEPAKIDTLEMVHTAERGNIVMTTGPFLEVSLKANEESQKRRGIPGDDVVAPNGAAELQVRVQCPNWFDINRVQVFLNGRQEKSLNFTRREHPNRFQDGVVKFEAKLPLQVKRDTHVIVAAVGENLQLGPVMGPERGKQTPIAVSNPIFVDVEGKGFEPNGDLLDLPFPK